MLTATDIREAKFQKSVNGYKQDQVDVLLDKIEADYIQYERIINDFQNKIEEQNREISELKQSRESVQNVLVGAQKLADDIVKEAKEKSEEIIKNAESKISNITEKEKEISAAFELKATTRKNEVEKELEEMIAKAKQKADSITAAANDCVARQQMLFDKLKLEIVSFKKTINEKYKEHFDILETIPDSVPLDANQMAELVSAELDRKPSPAEFIVPAAEEKPEAQKVEETFEKNDSSDGFEIEEFEDDF